MTSGLTLRSSRRRSAQMSDAHRPIPSRSDSTITTSGSSVRSGESRQRSTESQERQHNSGPKEGEEELDNGIEDARESAMSPTTSSVLKSAQQPSSSFEESASQLPLTIRDPSSPTVRTFGLSRTATQSAAQKTGSFSLTQDDLVRFRSAKADDETQGGCRMTTSEAAWLRWEESGGLVAGVGPMGAYAYDENGDGEYNSDGREMADGTAHKPEMSYVCKIRLILAASPRKVMTLAQVGRHPLISARGRDAYIDQIHQAIEERWPYFKTEGSTWRVSTPLTSAYLAWLMTRSW